MARSRALRRAVERLAAKPRGRRFVGEMRRDLVAYVHERRTDACVGGVDDGYGDGDDDDDDEVAPPSPTRFSNSMAALRTQVPTSRSRLRTPLSRV